MEAENLLVSCYERMHSGLAVSNARNLAARGRVHRLDLEWGRPEDAATWE